MQQLQQIIQTKNFKKLVILSFFAASALAFIGMRIYNHFYVSTDDAYVNAHVVQITPRITGKIDHLYVNNNQYVHKGDKLFAIDPEPYTVTVNSTKASLSLYSAELENASITQQRTLALVGKKFLSPQEGDNAIAAYKTSLAKVEQAKAELEQATLNLSYTNVVAPTSGWITNLTLREGDVVAENQPLFALISDEEFWVDANFKETEIERILPGQMASIKSDVYPSHEFRGVVESISGGAGAAFSLLPPQNATGNWVKVTQRVPIRIRVTNPSHRYPLRVGTSATVTVSLKSKS